MNYEHLGLGFLGCSSDKEPTCNAGDLDLITGLGRSPGEGNGYPLQYSGLKSTMDCIACQSLSTGFPRQEYWSG